MVKKVIKRKKEAKEEKVADEQPKEKKNKMEESAVEYQAGGLASLFGKSTDGAVVAEEVVHGDTVIEKPKKRSFVAKVEETAKESEAGADGEVATKEPTSFRKCQRENRKKLKETRKNVDESAQTIFVGNVPLTMNVKKIRKIFTKFGKIDSIRMRGIIPKTEKVSKRVAHMTGKFNENQNSLIFYVKFNEVESVEKALEYNGTNLDDHIIRVDKCTGKTEFSKDVAVFVGNLPFELTDEALFKFFDENVGPVASVRIVRDPATGKGKGFAFVNFKDDASASLALGMETIKMDKRVIRITRILKKPKIQKIAAAKKRAPKDKANVEIEGKLKNFKFSTKKTRTDEQNERRAMKKSQKKAIRKKMNAKKGRLMS
ncbi:unnamed protein product [Caenorhabditis bovis]|uniref:RRM domain-containing protein n=1 Tax=Caenorhabditis bovis TaxID=2654633 RepID=A0A8S1FAV9_9PELO|nr:unnamed protein product [Caenorhabditis bovis]